jgi:C1A family cysteine protease
MSKYIYNHKRQETDDNDHKFHLCVYQINSTTLPTHIDLRDSGNLPPVLDQSVLGSCTANATSNAIRYILKKENAARVFQPSRLFIYYYSRLIENTVNDDSGAVIRDVMKAVAMYGACSENNWTYDVSKFTIHPPLNVVMAAQTHIKSFQYMAVNQDLNSMKNALAQNFPIIFGMSVYTSFEDDIVSKTGQVPMPNLQNEENLGGHCQLICGFSDEKQHFIVMNSWNTSWGDNGFCYIPYQYLLDNNLASDFWVCRNFV